MLRTLLPALLMTALCAFDTGAQQTPAGALRVLAPLAGRWEGEGWSLTREGRAESRVVETAEYRLDGAVLVVEGVGRADAGTARERIVHHAFGVISWDAARGVGRMRAWRPDGNHVDADVAWENGVLEWGFEDPRAGRIRYRARIGAETWSEVGEISRDGGASWTQFMGMELRRVR